MPRWGFCFAKLSVKHTLNPVNPHPMHAHLLSSNGFTMTCRWPLMKFVEHHRISSGHAFDVGSSVTYIGALGQSFSSKSSMCCEAQCTFHTRQLTFHSPLALFHSQLTFRCPNPHSIPTCNPSPN